MLSRCAWLDCCFVFLLIAQNPPPCQQYYKAVGPLPLRAQPPLWRSPPTTPKKRKRTSEDLEIDASDLVGSSSKPRETHVADHVRKISRHRRRWEAPRTPPGYWDIGFPDTQETSRINERAAEIHAQKMRNAEAEAE